MGMVVKTGHRWFYISWLRRIQQKFFWWPVGPLEWNSSGRLGRSSMVPSLGSHGPQESSTYPILSPLTWTRNSFINIPTWDNVWTLIFTCVQFVVEVFLQTWWYLSFSPGNFQNGRRWTHLKGQTCNNKLEFFI